MLIVFSKSLSEFHESRPFQPFSLPYIESTYNIVIKLVICRTVYIIYHKMFNGVGNDNNIHMHISGILDLSKVYHQNNILLY